MTDPHSDRLPLSFRVGHWNVLCVGASSRLGGKAERLYRAGACLFWWQSLPPAWLGRPGVTVQSDWPGEGAFQLVLVDTEDGEEKARWLSWCRDQGLAFWMAGEPEASTVHFPSLVERGPLRIAVDTQGLAPTVARWLRQRLEQVLPDGLGAVLSLTQKRREQIEKRLPTPHQRRSFWYRLLEGQSVHRASLDGEERIARDLEEVLEESAVHSPQGQVFLVGAGPGDPDLLTVKALRLLGQADIVLYDRLVSEPILNRVRADAECIHVGKARSNHSVPQDRINQMLVDYAKAGKTVVRLKGGDPFIFGRGGEEIETLAENGVGFQVVPGITAASGCAAYAGIPLTHRRYAQSVRFVTGHLQDNTANLPWHELIDEGQTLVFYMGLVGLPIISRELMAHGMRPDMPVALVSKGTTPEQLTVTGTLESIVDQVNRNPVAPPTLVIVGDVVQLRDRLSWI
ncbi:MAG: siroheme synthase CysG [Oleiphilaceae bacterium]|nr:siroheme synthase CysG [Oleiphilaceae bacterium]